MWWWRLVIKMVIKVGDELSDEGGNEDCDEGGD